MTTGNDAAPRDLPPADWGRAIIEEILFRAARDLGEAGDAAAGISLSLDIRVTADAAGRAIIIETPGAVEPLIRTRLPLDD